MKNLQKFDKFKVNEDSETRIRPGRLKALCDMWTFDPSVIEKVFMFFGGSYDQTDEYLELMDGEETDNPADVWEAWSIENNIEHESNPFLDEAFESFDTGDAKDVVKMINKFKKRGLEAWYDRGEHAIGVWIKGAKSRKEGEDKLGEFVPHFTMNVEQSFQGKNKEKGGENGWILILKEGVEEEFIEEFEKNEHEDDPNYEILKGVCDDFNVELGNADYSIEQIENPWRIFKEPLLTIVMHAMDFAKKK